MAVDGQRRLSMDPPHSPVREARRKVVEKVTELVVAVADALEAQERDDAGGDSALRSLLRGDDADPGFVRGFVDTPIYLRLSSEYVAVDSGEHLLCRVVDILHELAPATFGRTRR